MKIPTNTLVLAMDGSKMLLLRNCGDATDPKLQAVAQEEADNPRASLQGTDRPGRAFSSVSPRRSSYGETDWHEAAKKDFAQRALSLLRTHQQEQGGDVIVIAAPAILGAFRKLRPEKLGSRIVAEIDKDLVNHAPEKIAAIIDAVEG